jgi:hypothetical protein
MVQPALLLYFIRESDLNEMISFPFFDDKLGYSGKLVLLEKFGGLDHE